MRNRSGRGQGKVGHGGSCSENSKSDGRIRQEDSVDLVGLFGLTAF